MIKVVEEKKKIRIEFHHPFDWKFIDICRKNRLTWNGDAKAWNLVFSPATIPMSLDKFLLEHKTLFNFFSSNVIDGFKLAFQHFINKYTNKPSKKTNFDLTKYKNVDDYQLVAAQFLLNIKAGILADDPGAGKTRSAAIYVLENKPKKVLFITPLSVREVWRDELVDSFGEKLEDFCLVDEKVENKKYVIINYDRLRKFLPTLEKIKWDVIIFDEAHYLKSFQSKRFKYSYKIAKKCKNVVCVTGTPIMNYPQELFPILKLIKHPLGGNFSEFANRYCDRKLISFGPRSYWDTKGASNLNELAEKLKDVMIRRLKKDLFEIPEKEYSIYKIDFSKKDAKAYDAILNDYRSFLKQGSQPMIHHLAKITKLRQFCADRKLEVINQHIKDALESNEKILIFGYFLDPLMELHKKYPESLMIKGDTKKEDRAPIVDKFQTDPYYKIFIGQIISSGVGITLTAANRVVFNDLYWNPGIHEQAEDRANRRGATLTTQIYYPLFRDSIEEDIHDLIKKKEVLINKIMDKSIDYFRSESFNKELVKNLTEKYGRK